MLKPIYTGVLQALTLVDDVKKLKSDEKEMRQVRGDEVALIPQDLQVLGRNCPLKNEKPLLVVLAFVIFGDAKAHFRRLIVFHV